MWRQANSTQKSFQRLAARSTPQGRESIAHDPKLLAATKIRFVPKKPTRQSKHKACPAVSTSYGPRLRDGGAESCYDLLQVP
jgi:hypothetical protein